jgi:hypothetical protein
MSLLNKQNIKLRALEIANHYCPHKTRYSPRFTQDLEKVVDAVIVAMIKDQQHTNAQTLIECDWSAGVIKQADQVHSIYREDS